MKKHLLLAFFALIVWAGIAQNPALEVKKHVLENGLTVYLNEDRTAKEVFGAVVVKAGSKNDPADATGMAHYLEHLLFKGTTELGTTDHEKEKPFLDSINYYYDQLGKTTDEAKRKRIQQLINKQSVEASKYALPTEFDKLMKSIGGTGLNAFTTEDMTVYHNAFPGEQMEKWLELYSHRFQNPVFRSFQSELEVVYEEKNVSMDDFETKLIEEMNKHLFKYHPYGTQTTIGTVEHLKNPSLTKMYNYFNTYYVANNMALVLCGNFDAEKTLRLIEEKFGKLRTGEVPEFPEYPKTEFTSNEILEVKYTPIKVSFLGFKTVPTIHPDRASIEVLLNLLFNESETGKLNKLQRDRKLMFAGCGSYTFNDDGAAIFFIIPKIVGQSFEEAEKLMFDEIDKIRKGELSDTDLQIIKTELYRQRQQELENYAQRTFSIVQTFGDGSTWEDYLNYSKEIESVTKEDVMKAAEKYLGAHYFAIHSKTGFPKKDVLEKPGFKPVVTEQKEESAFAKRFNETMTSEASPKFIDFEKDVSLLQLNESNKLYVTKNPINDVFSLGVQYKVGRDSIKNLDLAADLFNYFHTEDMSMDKLKEEFALLGLTYYSYCNDDRLMVIFTGLDAHLEASLKLINKLLNQPVVDATSIEILQNDIISDRKYTEKEPDFLGYALYEYVRLGEQSPYIDRVGTKDLKKLEAAQLLEQYKKATTYNAVWHYAGTESPEKIQSLMKANMSLQDNKKETPLSIKNNQISPENIVYFVNDKKAIQSQIYFTVNSNNYQANPTTDARISAFNQYMAGSFSGLILQEIREFRSLAYSAYGFFSKPKLSGKPTYFFSYVGCQADKTIEAVDIMCGLLNNMPEKEERMPSLRSLLKNGISAKYPNFRRMSTTIEKLRERGYTSDPLKDEYPEYDKLAFEDVVDFYKEFIKDKPIIITVYGNKKRIDMDKLAQFGKVVELKKKKIILE